MTPKKPSAFGPRGAWLAAALWGSASLSGAQAQAPDPGPIDTAEAPPLPAYGVRPDPGPEPRPVTDANGYQGLWMSGPSEEHPDWHGFHLAITGDRLFMRDPTSAETGESSNIQFLSEIPTHPTSWQVRVALTQRVLNGAQIADTEETWVVTIGLAGVEKIMRKGEVFVRGPARAPEPAYGLPPEDHIPVPPTPKPLYGLPPSPDIKPKR